VRPPTFFQQCRDQQWYIQQLKSMHSGYNSQIAELRSRLGDLQQQQHQRQPEQAEPRVPMQAVGRHSHGFPTSEGRHHLVSRGAAASSPENNHARNVVAGSAARSTSARRKSSSCLDLESGQLDTSSSANSSDSEDSSSEDVDSANAVSVVAAAAAAEENDVDVEVADQGADFRQPSLLSELDSLTTEPSIDGSSSTAAADDEVSLMRLIDLSAGGSDDSSRRRPLSTASQRLQPLTPFRGPISATYAPYAGTSSARPSSATTAEDDSGPREGLFGAADSASRPPVMRHPMPLVPPPLHASMGELHDAAGRRRRPGPGPINLAYQDIDAMLGLLAPAVASSSSSRPSSTARAFEEREESQQVSPTMPALEERTRGPE